MGGWTNEQLVQAFGEYARLCFDRFGPFVKTWITFNEPYVFAMKGYDFATFAPGIKDPLEGPYKVIHTMLKSHALAYQIYQAEFKGRQGGRIGLALDSSNYSAKDSDSKDDLDVVDKAYQFRVCKIFYIC